MIVSFFYGIVMEYEWIITLRCHQTWLAGKVPYDCIMFV